MTPTHPHRTIHPEDRLRARLAQAERERDAAREALREALPHMEHHGLCAAMTRLGIVQSRIMPCAPFCPRGRAEYLLREPDTSPAPRVAIVSAPARRWAPLAVWCAVMSALCLALWAVAMMVVLS